MIGKKRLSQFFVAALEENDKQNKSVFLNLSDYKKYYFKESTAPGMPSPAVTGTQQRATSQTTQPKVQTKLTSGFGSGVSRGKGVPTRRTGFDAITGVGSDGSGGVDSIIGMYLGGKAAETGGDVASALGANAGKLLGAAGAAKGGFVGGLGQIGGGLLQKGGNLLQVALGEIGKGMGTQWIEQNVGNIANTMQQAYAQDAGSPIGMVVPGETQYKPAKATVKTADEKAAEEDAAREAGDERRYQKARRDYELDQLARQGYGTGSRP